MSHNTQVTAKLLPPAPGLCPVCATKHDPNRPHNQQSLYYQMRFYGLHGRWPTWADALAQVIDIPVETIVVPLGVEVPHESK